MSLSETIKNLVINDYFTPNIKAEVILDTLLTPYIGKILPAAFVPYFEDEKNKGAPLADIIRKIYGGENGPKRW